MSEEEAVLAGSPPAELGGFGAFRAQVEAELATISEADQQAWVVEGILAAAGYQRDRVTDKVTRIDTPPSRLT